MKLWRLDAVRGAAASLVALGHVFPSVPGLASFGQEAVIVFFLLSGFVIEYSSARKLSRGFGYYFIKRFLRIYPVLICLFVLVCLLTGTSISSPGFLRKLVGNLLMLQDFTGGKPHVIVRALFSASLWSLHYEWWFYMLYFPIVTRVRPGLQTVLVGIGGILAALSYLFWPYPPNRLLMYFPIWWAGVVMARIYIADGRITMKSMGTSLWFLAGIAFILSVSAVSYLRGGGRFMPGLHPLLEVRHVSASVAIIGLAAIWQYAGWKGFRPLLGWGCWIAPISYALYIAHEPLLEEASYLRGCVPHRVEELAYVLVLLVFCVVSELWLYRGLNRWFEASYKKSS